MATHSDKKQNYTARVWQSGFAAASIGAVGLIGCSLLFSPSTAVNDDAGSTNGDSGSANDDAGAGTDCPANYTEAFMGSRYRIAGSNPFTWYQAQRTCEEEGTHLVVIDSQEEAKFLDDLGFVGWIGATDHQAESTFRWVTGAAVGDGFQRWGPGEFNDLSGAEDCVQIMIDGYLWRDFGCDVQLPYVCECDAQEPADTWCVTGTDTDCSICGHDCNPLGCRDDYCAF